MNDRNDDFTEKTGMVVVRVPQDLLKSIDRQAGRELISRSDLVRRTLNAVFGEIA